MAPGLPTRAATSPSTSTVAARRLAPAVADPAPRRIASSSPGARTPGARWRSRSPPGSQPARERPKSRRPARATQGRPRSGSRTPPRRSATSASRRSPRERPAIWNQLRLQSNVSLDEHPPARATATARASVELDVTVDGTEGAALGVMSQGELHALALSLFIPRATLPESPFRFVVIDDPVQSMDPARVDGLARVLRGDGEGAPGRRLHPRRPPARGRAPPRHRGHRHRGHARARAPSSSCARRHGPGLALHRGREHGRQGRPARPTSRAASSPASAASALEAACTESRPPPPHRPGRAPRRRRAAPPRRPDRSPRSPRSSSSTTRAGARRSPPP